MNPGRPTSPVLRNGNSPSAPPQLARGIPAPIHSLSPSRRPTHGAAPLDAARPRPGIGGTAYDTAWLASVPSRSDPHSSRFPAAVQWLVENQLPDGSWGGKIRYEHDRILSTLAALVPLVTFGRHPRDRASVDAGTRYLWQHGHLLASEPAELVGFELLLPALVERAQRVGVAVPPHLDTYREQRSEKLRLIPRAALYSPRVTVVHSLEFLGDQADLAGLRAAQGSNGAIGNSPAATAFFLARTDDARAQAYLEACLAHSGEATVPVLHPCETFELLWAAYHLYLAGVPASALLGLEERAMLRAALQQGGVGLSPTFPIPDADDTAVALLLLHDLGDAVDPTVLQAFSLPQGHFASFPHERHSSVGVNLHVLHALLRVPGYHAAEAAVERVLDYLVEHQVNGLYWLDKWHISPYYATAHALRVLAVLPPDQARRMSPIIKRSREWLRQTQNRDGSWGFYGEPTAEETAYAALALAGGERRAAPSDQRRSAAAAAYLLAHADGSPRKDGAAETGVNDSAARCLNGEAVGRDNARDPYPPLWIDKCLYTPTLVVESAIEAARIACARASPSTDEPAPRSRRRGSVIKPFHTSANQI